MLATSSSMKARITFHQGRVSVRLLIRHPMETGSRRDADGRLIPAHYIQHFSCRHNDQIVLTGQLGTGVAKNPYLSFSFDGAYSGDRLSMHWEDNQGRQDTLIVAKLEASSVHEK